MLTRPLTPAEVQNAYPADTRGLGEPERLARLEMLEGALRAEYRVTRGDPEADFALRTAMLAAWPSFAVQVRGVASESVSTDGASQSYATGDQQVRFPAFIATMLAPVADPRPSTIRLMRS